MAPGYAPRGVTLVASPVPGIPETRRPSSARSVGRLAALYDTAECDLVRTIEVPHALPAMTAPHPLRKPVRLAPGRYVCGDHRATSSIQGALASGRRAAAATLTEMLASV
jgi:flavin-dependent amine oxidoreductase